MLKKYTECIEEPEKPFPGPTSSPFTQKSSNKNAATDVTTNIRIVKENSSE